MRASPFIGDTDNKNNMDLHCLHILPPISYLYEYVVPLATVLAFVEHNHMISTDCSLRLVAFQENHMLELCKPAPKVRCSLAVTHTRASYVTQNCLASLDIHLLTLITSSPLNIYVSHSRFTRHSYPEIARLLPEIFYLLIHAVFRTCTSDVCDPTRD